MVYMSFNSDSTCFTYGKSNGFAVYNTDPLSVRFNRFTNDTNAASGIGIVELLCRSNMLAIVGGCEKPQYPSNVMMLWDDYQNKAVAELTFKTEITGVKIKRDLILITTIDNTYVYNFKDVKLLESFETIHNPTGISAMSTGDTERIIAVLSAKPGMVVVKNIRTNESIEINAHNNPINAMALNNNGTLLATVSCRGTLIRLWDPIKGILLKELRRGLEVVTITSLRFNKDSTQLLASSTKGTVHIYSLDADVNKKSMLEPLSGWLPTYFSGEWSAVSFQVPVNSICSFGVTSNTIFVLCRDTARFYKYGYDIKTQTSTVLDMVELCKL